MSQRIQVYSDTTLCWWISGSQNFEGLYCLHLQEWQTPCDIKMLNGHTESHRRRSESGCKIVKLDHSIKKTHTGRQKKNQSYFKNFIRFSNVFTSTKSQCFLITCNYIFCSVKYYDGINHPQTGSLSSDTRRNRKTHTLTALLLFLLPIPYVLFNGVFFENPKCSLL
jgi:hypothetical protein